MAEPNSDRCELSPEDLADVAGGFPSLAAIRAYFQTRNFSTLLGPVIGTSIGNTAGNGGDA